MPDPFRPLEGKYRLFIFNPETDYALAAGSPNYNPPRIVMELRKRMAQIQKAVANPGDMILLLDKPTHPTEEEKQFSVTLPEAAEYISHRRLNTGETPVITPWGWNQALRQTLLNYGISPEFLKSTEEIDSLRMLSHRRNTIPMTNGLIDRLELPGVAPPLEIKDVEDAIAECNRHPLVFVKAPWSSSGRGVITSAMFSEIKLREWISGCIRRQGSVMIERGYRRNGDFATEWWIEDGRAQFLGLSMFTTSPEGRYGENVLLSDEEIGKEISSRTPLWSRKVIEAQKMELENLLGSGYEGPAGIDMMTTTDGLLIPCVEINLRFTMGLIALYRR